MIQTETQIVTQQALVDWLRRAGIPVDEVRRVIIDAKVDDAVRVYIEQYGTDRMFKVEPPDLSKAEITLSAPDEGEAPE